MEPTPVNADPASTAQLAKIPESRPQNPFRHSLCCSLPVGVRHKIWDYLLSLENTPTHHSYADMSCSEDSDASDLEPDNKHSALYISKQLSAEYRKCYYERTTFFLPVDRDNAHRGIPPLGDGVIYPKAANTGMEITRGKVPNFWGDSDMLVRNLRRCTLNIEMGDIITHVAFLHDVARNVSTAVFRSVSSSQSIRSQYGALGTVVYWAILSLLLEMHQLRSIDLFWDTTVRILPESRCDEDMGWLWEALGEPVWDLLKEKESLEEMKVKVGDSYSHTTWIGKKVGGVWTCETEKKEDDGGL